MAGESVMDPVRKLDEIEKEVDNALVGVDFGDKKTNQDFRSAYIKYIYYIGEEDRSKAAENANIMNAIARDYENGIYLTEPILIIGGIAALIAGGALLAAGTFAAGLFGGILANELSKSKSDQEHHIHNIYNTYNTYNNYDAPQGDQENQEDHEDQYDDDSEDDEYTDDPAATCI